MCESALPRARFRVKLNDWSATMATATNKPSADTVAEDCPPVDADAPVEGAKPDSAPDQADRRRIPEIARRALVRLPSGRLYLPAAHRLVWFRDEKPDWEVSTDLVEGGQEAGFATVKATIRTPEGRAIATGMKTETRSDFPAGWVEKAETGAIGRALAVAGYGTQFAMDLDDDPGRSDIPGARSGNREVEAPRRRPDEIWPGPGQCLHCHAPEGKPHGKRCTS